MVSMSLSEMTDGLQCRCPYCENDVSVKADGVCPTCKTDLHLLVLYHQAGRRAFSKGRTALATGNARDAVAPLLLATEMLPDQPDALLLLAQAYHQLGDDRGASQWAERALGVDGVHEGATQLLAELRHILPVTATKPTAPPLRRAILACCLVAVGALLAWPFILALACLPMP